MRVTMNIKSKTRYCRNGIAFLLFLQICIPTQLYAATPSLDEIIRKTEHTAYYLGNDGSARVKMTITDSQDRERKRRFSILRLDEQAGQQDLQGSSGKQKYYLHINYPSDLKNTVLLVWKNPGGGR